MSQHLKPQFSKASISPPECDDANGGGVVTVALSNSDVVNATTTTASTVIDNTDCRHPLQTTADTVAIFDDFSGKIIETPPPSLSPSSSSTSYDSLNNHQVRAFDENAQCSGSNPTYSSTSSVPSSNSSTNSDDNLSRDSTSETDAVVNFPSFKPINGAPVDDVAATASLRSTNVEHRRKPKILPNSNCQTTANVENDFLTAHGFRPYTDAVELNVAPTVVYSRAMDKRFVYYGNGESLVALSASELKRYFQQTGHTLTITHLKSYVRYVSFDLDCIPCHKHETANSMDTDDLHLSELSVRDICDDLQKLLSFTAEPFNISLWKRNCGYHVYTDVPVSMPIHLQIGAALQAKFANDPTVIIEIPETMPLPYSAKTLNDPYRPAVETPVNLSLPILQPRNDYWYYEQYGIVKQAARTNPALCVNLTDASGPGYFTALQSCGKKRQTLPIFLNVQRVHDDDDTVYQYPHMKRVADFIKDVINAGGKILAQNRSPTTLADDAFALSLDGVGADNDDGAEDAEIVPDWNRLNGDSRLRAILRDYGTSCVKFFNTFNELNFGLEFDDVLDPQTLEFLPNSVLSLYIKHSAVAFTGLNLQHYVVAMRKCLKHESLKDIKFDDFSVLIRALYADVPIPSVQHFTASYRDEIAEMYPEQNFKNILKYMRIYIIEEITPYMDSKQMFDQLMCNRLKAKNPQEFLNSVTSKNSKPKSTEFSTAFIDVCKSFRFLVYSSSTMLSVSNTMFYYDSDTTSYGFMDNWYQSFYSTAVASIMKQSGIFEAQFTCIDNPYMTATKMGLFSAITGLYSSRTTLVSFDKGRTRVICPYNQEPCAYPGLNCDLLRFSKIANRVTAHVRDNVDDMFVRFQFIPSVMSLTDRSLENLNRIVIGKFFKHIDHHKTLPNTLWLTELLPYDAQFIVYMLTLLSQYGLQLVLNYQQLCRMLFGNVVNSKLVNGKMWREHFQMTMHCDFQERDFESPMFSGATEADGQADKLLKFDWEPSDLECNEYSVVVGTVLVAALAKCKNFAPMFAAFGCADQPDATRHAQPYEYDDYMESSLSNYQELYDRIVESMLQEEPGPNQKFERILYKMSVHLLLATSFNPKSFQEALNIFSTLICSVNIKKKLYVLYGNQNVGKSYMLNIITDIMQPGVHVLNHLEEAQSRSGLSSKVLLLRCNELQSLNPSMLKTITGNDPNSNKVYFSQKYVLRTGGQASIFAATNVHVEFKNNAHAKSVSTVDRATIDRFHTLVLTGTQIHESGSHTGKNNMFSMTAYQQTFIPVLKLEASESALALQWLMFENYAITRHPKTFEPYIDVDFIDSVNYKHQVYKNSVQVYDFLSFCGFSEEPGFAIQKSTFMRVVSREFDDVSVGGIAGAASSVAGQQSRTDFDSGNASMTKNKFIKLFLKQYKVDLATSTDELIHDIQFTEVIANVKYNMKTEYAEDHNIDTEELNHRLKAYTSEIDRNNAEMYFCSRNHSARMKKKSSTYVNLRFAHPEPEIFQGECCLDDDDDDACTAAGSLNDNGPPSSNTDNRSDTSAENGYRPRKITTNNNVPAHEAV